MAHGSRRALRLAGLRRRPRAPRPPRDGAGSEKALRERIVWQGGRLDPAMPARIWSDWVNTALRTRGQADAARAAIVEAGLHPHRDAPKNWDALVALGLVLDRVPRDGRVLDAGSTQYSRLLPWLYLYGYRRLHGIDLTYDGRFKAGPIRYARMDLTATTFRSGWFDAIACLSVIEHGVPLDAFLRESARLLRPGGLLVTSTDFWCSSVPTDGLEAYGVPVKVFTAAEIEALVAASAAHGFRLVGALDLACEERVVRWERLGLDFTFVNVVLERTDEGAVVAPLSWRDRVRAALGRPA